MSFGSLERYPGPTEVMTADTIVIGAERASGATLTARSPSQTDGPDTITIPVAGLGGPARVRAVRSRRTTRSAANRAQTARSIGTVAAPGPTHRTADPAGRGRHAAPPARPGWARRGAVRLFQNNTRVLAGAVITVALVVIGASLVGRGGAPGRACTLFYPGAQHSDVCADPTGTVSTDNLTISATPLAATDNAAGGLSLCSSVTLTNDSASDQGYSAVDFKIQNPGGEMTSPTSGTLHTAGTLAPGGTKTGTICDERAALPGLYAVIYEPSLLGAHRGVWLAQH